MPLSLLPLDQRRLADSIPDTGCTPCFLAPFCFRLANSVTTAEEVVWMEEALEQLRFCAVPEGDLSFIPSSATCFQCSVSKRGRSQTWPVILFHSFFWQLWSDLSKTLCLLICCRQGLNGGREKSWCSSPKCTQWEALEDGSTFTNGYTWPSLCGEELEHPRVTDKDTHRSSVSGMVASVLATISLLQVPTEIPRWDPLP